MVRDAPNCTHGLENLTITGKMFIPPCQLGRRSVAMEALVPKSRSHDKIITLGDFSLYQLFKCPFLVHQKHRESVDDSVEV